MNRIDKMKLIDKSLLLAVIFAFSLLSPIVASEAEAQDVSSIEILQTVTNPHNNNTYHLLSEGTWEDSAEVARGLDGFLVTIDDEQENQWIMDTFSNSDEQVRHLWIGLSDQQEDGYYKWHDGTPFYYRNWGADQPSSNGDENYVHIAGTNMGNIMPGYWNDLENDPQYFPVYGIVEVGPGADYALRFDGIDDKIVIDDELPDWEGKIEIEALVNVPDTSGIQFITMLGDYGWGLYLNNGNVAYSSEYSISKHPTSNTTINSGEWTHVKVIVEEGTYGEFFIDGQPSGMFEIEDAKIPLGDFGSNNCYQSGDECDELYIGRMGAGCECNYFRGMLDNVTIRNAENEITWTFPEGEGSVTEDDSGTRNGVINGASWVMPDGSIVAQAIQLFNEKELYGISGNKGDQLLFFVEIEPLTKNLFIEAYQQFTDDMWGEDFAGFDAYFAHNYIPNSWEHDSQAEFNFGFMFESWDWPEEGIMWMVIVPRENIEELTIYTFMEIADPPPALDEMTELINGIPVTGQSIDGGRGTPKEDRILYYYVDVKENLSALTIKTYDGSGNVDLAISWGTVPDPFGFFFGFEDIWDPEVGGNNGKSATDNGPGNDHQVTLYDVEPGIYYVATYTFGKAYDYTIAASMTFQPENIEPEDAVELTPGVPYGPLSGYDGLLQYFKVDVPQGTERLEVDLDSGFGEASLFMKLGDAPTTSDFTHLSNSPGAGDKIGFNDPTPGMWYILLATEMVFGEVKITASFEDRYVWSYDGTPIELFNGEEISGIETPAGESLNFFVELEKPGDYLVITTYGGSGSLMINAVGNAIDFGFDDLFGGFAEDFIIGAEGRQKPGNDFESNPVSVDSTGIGTNQEIFIEFPANGKFDITLTAVEDISEVTIVASWVYSNFIDPIEEPKVPVVTQNCRDVAENEMSSKDLNADGLLSKEEAKSVVLNDKFLDFTKTDINSDDEIEFAELLQQSCNCGNEMELIYDQLSPDDQEVNIEKLSAEVYENSYDFFDTDLNSNLKISRSEVDILILLCETTFDAFDGDGDGVPDVDDMFPDDPNESKDSDGDGVGDNADLAPSVANDLIYSAGAIIAIGLLAMLVLVSRGSRGKNQNSSWEMDKQFDIAEKMLDMEDEKNDSRNIDHDLLETTNLQSAQHENFNLEVGNEQVGNLPQNENLFEQLLGQPEPVSGEIPPQQLLGMIDSSGLETIEYPFDSGITWQRTDASQTWERK